MKIVGITGIGTYPVPWLKYGLASIYNVVDEIVVVNSGYNFPFFTEYDVPLLEESQMMKELDVNGKIREIQHVTWEKASKFGPELLESREGIRALGMTYANDVANDLGADWILRFDSDQVFFPNVKKVRELAKGDKGDGFQFLEYKAYWISPNTMVKGGEVSHSDGAKFYQSIGQQGQRQWFAGEGAIVHYRPQFPNKEVTTGHFREVHPALPDGTPDRRGLFLNYFQRMLFHNFDQNRLYAGTDKPGWEKGLTRDEMILRAFNTARGIAYGKYDLVPSVPTAPLVIRIGASKYISEGFPK